MPRLRLGYTKSRGGCLRCKQRRVKCDENRPCKACARHGIECSLVSGPDSREGSSTSATETPLARERLSPDSDYVMKVSGGPSLTPATPAMSATPQTMESQDQLTTPTESTTVPSDLSTPTQSLASSPPPTAPDPFPYFAKFTAETGLDEKENWASDLELLHHYTAYTCKAIVKGYSMEIWQITIPKLAFSNSFLLHELLAISAFHLAYLHPENEKKYTVQATHHQSRAIEGMREALENISAENCHALFSASTMLFVGSLAASQPKDENTGQDFSFDNLIDIFLLLKGVRGIIDSTHQLGLTHGPLKELFLPMSNVTPSPNLMRIIAQLHNLLGRTPEMEHTAGEHHRGVIEREIERLVERIEYASHKAASPEYQTIAAWPLSMSESFIGLLRSRNQAALAVLSYYCVVMHSTEDDYWYTRGWGMSVIRDIAKDLTPPWNQDAAWALGWMTGQVNVQ